MRRAVDIALCVALAAGVLYFGWRWFGPVGLVYAMPVLGIFAKMIVEAVAWLPRFAARQALRKFEGRYFEFRGRSMDIHIDDDALCWVSTADARKIVALPADAVVARIVPTHCRELGDPPRWRITPEGLALFLAKSTDADVARFCRWLEVDVARPARNRRDGRKVPG